MRRLIGIVVLLAVIGFGGRCLGQGREEFNGPFASWADVKQRFGARGDGTTDDTRALQNALDHLANPAMGSDMGTGGYTVVYLPAGTYCISSTLQLKGKIGVCLVGEDPSRTILKWTGKDSTTMLLADGSAYFEIDRFQWDANGRKGMEGIGIHWRTRWNDGKTRSFASLNIQIADDLFTDGFQYGIGGGTNAGEGTGANDSEVTIRRCVFNQCNGAGIEITGFNAIDYWIWDCRFLNCNRGVHCTRGIYHLYRSYFSGSTESDMHNNNGYYLGARGCYFENSKAWSLDDGSSCNPFKRIFQDNIVVRPGILPVEYYHLGKITLMGNRIGATVDTTYKFSINTKGWCPGIYEVLSLHNVYEYAHPIRIASNPQKLYAFGDRYGTVVKPGAAAFLKTLEPTPRKAGRTIMEVPAGAGAAVIQAILDKAAAMRGRRPVVHFGMGTYTIGKTLVIAGGSDMQLEGDGLIYSSVIVKKADFPPGQPLILVMGPSGVTIRDLQIGSQSGKDRAPGIVFDRVDQPMAQAHLDQVYSHADTSLVVTGMDHLYVEKDNSFFTDGNYVVGGALTGQGKGEAAVNCFGGQFTGTTVRNNARFLAKDCWWEGPARFPVDLEGEGSVTIDGAMIAPGRLDSNTTIRIGKFNGKVCLMNMYLQGALAPTPADTGLSLLLWNVHFYFKMDPLDFLKGGAAFRAAFLGLNTQCFNTADPECKTIYSISDRLNNISDVYPFLDAMTLQDRMGSPRALKNLPAGVTNIDISRVTLGSMNEGIVFRADK
jgi:hypothetical protein